MNHRDDEPDQTLPPDSREDDVPLEDEVPEDDTIIARAFAWSLAVAGGLALVAVVAWWLLDAAPEPVAVEEAAVAAPVAAPQGAEPPAVRFTDVAEAWGIDFVHVSGAYGERLLPETMGAGVAVADLDGDGDPELLFVNGRQWPWREATAGATPALYRNDGGGRYTDITAGSGLDFSLYGTGVAVADYDGDGLRDVFIAAVGPNRLLHNLGAGRFEDVTTATGVAGADDAWSTSAAFLDYDRDGDLDLFVTNYVRWSREIDFDVDYRLTGIGRAYGPPTNYAGTHSYLYRNDGGRYTDVSAEAGIQVLNKATGLPMGKGLAVTAADLDEDGWLDILVANDTVQNFLFRNRGDGSFEEIGTISGVAFDNTGAATGAMGIDTAEYGAGTAVAIGNFANEMTSFYVSSGGNGLFSDEAVVSGIGPSSRQALSFGLFFFDYDLDGRLDLLQTNGHIEDEINVVQPSQHYEQPTQLFWNCGWDCPRPFVPVAAGSAGDLAIPAVGRGAAYGDLDGDGDPDVVITQAGRRPLVLRNDQSLGHAWLRVRLAGPPGNIDGIGARVTLTAGDRSQARIMMPARSYLSSVEPVLTFGLGDAERVERLEVAWPDGRTTRLAGVAPGQALTVRYDSR